MTETRCEDAYAVACTVYESVSVITSAVLEQKSLLETQAKTIRILTLTLILVTVAVIVLALAMIAGSGS